MACNEYEKQLEVLEDYASGTLSGPEAAKVRAHLESCAFCHEEVEVARAGGELLRAAFTPTADPGGTFWYRVQAGISAHGRQARADFWGSLELLARRLAWTAALVAALLGGYTALAHVGVLSRDVGETTTSLTEEPAGQPSNAEEVLLTLAERER